MSAGRPHNSTTPAWRSKPAVKVGMYHFLCYIMHKTPTMYGCAKEMGVSRTTAIKWFEVTRWDELRNRQYRAVKDWIIYHIFDNSCHDVKLCSSELNVPEEDVLFYMEMYKIQRRYIIT